MILLIWCLPSSPPLLLHEMRLFASSCQQSVVGWDCIFSSLSCFSSLSGSQSLSNNVDCRVMFSVSASVQHISVTSTCVNSLFSLLWATAGLYIHLQVAFCHSSFWWSHIAKYEHQSALLRATVLHWFLFNTYLMFCIIKHFKLMYRDTLLLLQIQSLYFYSKQKRVYLHQGCSALWMCRLLDKHHIIDGDNRGCVHQVYFIN